MTVKEPHTLKEQLLLMAKEDLEQFLIIVGEIGYDGYQILKYKMKGNSYQQCAVKFDTTKSCVQKLLKKCIEKGYTAALFKLNMLK